MDMPGYVVLFIMKNLIHQQVADICDKDGSKLYQREDDKSETVKRRIDVYLNQTSPLIAYYREQESFGRNRRNIVN